MPDSAPLQPSVPAPQLSLRGAPTVTCDGGTPQPLGLPDALLLAWLALEGPTPRERLARLLWPGSDEASARNALRQRLFRLRRQYGTDLVAGQSVLELAAGVTHDLGPDRPLLGALAAGEGELADWLAQRRARTQAAARRQAEARIEALERSGDIAAALPLAQALVDQAPLSEDAHCRLMRLHYLRGDRAAALLAFDRLEQLLKHEVGAAPSPTTLALLATIERAAADAPSPAGTVPVAVLRPPRLVGRADEFAALRRGWRAGQVTLVTGEAGIGKSRLLQALAQETTGVLAVSCRPGDALVPYAAIARLLRPLLDRSGLAEDAPLHRRLATLLPERTGHARGQAVGAEDLREAARRARHGGASGFIVDDLHFADAASLELLEALLAGPGPADGDPPWCLSLRPPPPDGPLHSLVEAVVAAGPVTRVRLAPLGAAALAELVDSLTLPGIDGQRLAPVLRQRSGGNPLFALETLKLAWVEKALDRPEALPQPQTLGQLIADQLARLSPTALSLARLAGVAGPDFSIELAEQVLGTHALALADPWKELEVQQVLVGTEFAHDLVHEAVLEGLPDVISRHLHGQAADWLARHGGEPARVAAHWEAAGRPERALEWLRAAADTAHRALREVDRIDFLLRAADLAEAAGQTDEAFESVARAVETSMNSIRRAGGLPLLDRLDRLARTPWQRAFALGHRAWYMLQMADDQAALAIGQQALALALPLSDPTLVLRLRQRVATIEARLGQFEAARTQLASVEPQAAQHLSLEEQAEFHGNYAMLLDNMGCGHEALAQHRQAIALSEASGDHAQRSTHLANLAVNRLNAGDAAGALATVEEAAALVRTYELVGSSAAFVSVLRLQCARALGRYAQALAAADHALALLRTDNPARLPIVQVHLGHAWLDLGQPARAWQALQQAGESGRLPAHVEVRRQVLLARLLRERGQDAAPALAAAQRAVPPAGWPEAALMVELEDAVAASWPQARPALQALAERASRAGWAGSALAATLRLAERATGEDPALAASAAEAALRQADHAVPTMMCRAAVWAHAAAALAAANRSARAAAVADEGRRWLLDTARLEVDHLHREAFLERNPVHRQLLALAARLGVTSDAVVAPRA